MPYQPKRDANTKPRVRYSMFHQTLLSYHSKENETGQTGSSASGGY